MIKHKTYCRLSLVRDSKFCPLLLVKLIDYIRYKYYIEKINKNNTI